MLAFTGANLVLRDRIMASGTLVVDHGRIAGISPGAAADSAEILSLPGHTIVPGLIDVHVHGVDGIDTFDTGDAIARIADRLPRHGVTAFCPTTVACEPGELARVLAQVARCRAETRDGAARVLPAHLESNFINPDYCGAQPRSCLRIFASAQAHPDEPARSPRGDRHAPFTADEVLRVINECQQHIAIVTLAPEMPGGPALIEWLRARGVRVSLGHSGASYEDAIAAIDAGARQATHLFNRMPPFHHRHPGLIGAVLDRDEVVAEIICDGAHVHPALVRMAIAVKGTERVLAITDGTAASGCPIGTCASLGGQSIVAGARTAQLRDGTIAGSVITMDGAFRWLTGAIGMSLVDAATMCSTSPARVLGLPDFGVLAEGAVADLVVLDADRRVVRTYVGGRLAYERDHDHDRSNSSRAPSV